MDGCGSWFNIRTRFSCCTHRACTRCTPAAAAHALPHAHTRAIARRHYRYLVHLPAPRTPRTRTACVPLPPHFTTYHHRCTLLPSPTRLVGWFRTHARAFCRSRYLRALPRCRFHYWSSLHSPNSFQLSAFFWDRTGILCGMVD